MNVFSTFADAAQKCSSDGDFQRKCVPSNDVRMQLPDPEYDIAFLRNPANRDMLAKNAERRKVKVDMNKIVELCRQPAESRVSSLSELGRMPNLTDPRVLNNEEPSVLKTCGICPKYNFKPKEFSELAKQLKILRTEDLGSVMGEKSYVFIGELAELEEALVRYTIQRLLARNFRLTSVPDIIPTELIERCGLAVSGRRTLVYTLEPYYGGDLSLSGTAEMALAGKLMNLEIICEELPLKLCAVSRCYRAEISRLQQERSIYRVHQFTKVEMFLCCHPSESIKFFDELLAIQEELFSDLGLHLKMIDMPPHELGSPAYRKVDAEGWMPGREQFGELSSCSNCTDYQSRRLNIKCKDRKRDGKAVHVHTLNGTACALPRILIALCETHQTEEGHIQIPQPLVPYMRGKSLIGTQRIGDMRSYKYKPKLFSE